MFIFLKFWKEILIAVLAAIAISTLYDKVYQSGYEESNRVHKEYIDEYNKKLDARIDSLQVLSTDIYEQKRISDANLSKSLKQILDETKKGPLVIEKDGKCTLSPSFVDSYNKAIDRTNGK